MGEQEVETWVGRTGELHLNGEEKRPHKVIGLLSF